MRYLPQFLIRWLAGRNRRNNTTWTRETPWRQGSVLPSARAIELGLVDKHESSNKIALVISHDCDLASEIEDEPNVEIITGSSVKACLPDKSHAKNVRVLHIEINRLSGRVALELVAKNKASIPKHRMADFGPDTAYSIDKDELQTFRSWLAARYKRASIPDSLQALIRSVFADSVKKKDERPHALRGIWIDFEPDTDHLPRDEKYELWIAVVYSTSVEGSKAVAEEVAKEIKRKLEKKYTNELDLRECVVRSDTEFTYYDTYRYKLFRLEHLSIRTGASLEVGNE